MARCDRCGNDYDKSFTVSREGKMHTFDSFECALSMLAPECAHCKCKIIGHGVEAMGRFEILLLRPLRGEGRSGRPP